MAGDQSGEGVVVAMSGEIVQELAVCALPVAAVGRQLVDVPQKCAELCPGHTGGSPISGSHRSSRRDSDPYRLSAERAYQCGHV
jgi:hypothetical protein